MPVIVSSVTKPGLAETARAADGARVFQLYVRGDDSWIDDIVHQAVDAGYVDRRRRRCGKGRRHHG